MWEHCKRRVTQATNPVRRAEQLLAYLEAHPTGRYNRAAAEAIERCLDEAACTPDADAVHRRFRALRDRHMPPVVPGSWKLGS